MNDVQIVNIVKTLTKKYFYNKFIYYDFVDNYNNLEYIGLF